MREHDDNGTHAISDQAAEWFIRLRDRDLSATERRRFVHWLKRSPSHIAEFMRLCRLYGRVKRANLPTLPPEGDLSNVIQLIERAPLPTAERRRESFEWWGKARFAAVAVCLALVGVIASIALSSNTIETSTGEWRSVQLADGSTVSAGPNTLVRVEYSQGIRRVRLARGDALFKVAKDSSRPFIVNAGGAVARAVGTQFGVERGANRIRVTVAEGRVAVVRGDQAAALEHAVDFNVAQALNADERVDIRLDAPTVPLHVEKVNAANALAWAIGKVSVQDKTVGEAVEEFNRRNRLQLQLDPALASWHVCCGVFDAADPEAFAKHVAATGETMGESVAVMRAGDTLRIVRQGPGQAEPPARTP